MSPPAQAAWQWSGPCDGWRYGETLTHDTPVAVRQRRMRRLIRCIFDRFAPAEASFAVVIAERESSLYPWAYNRATDCRGLFQHLGRYWPGRVEAYLERDWYRRDKWPELSAFNPHANAIAAAKMVRASGWGAWSTA